MSLHTLAQHLQTAGRGDDKVLVHMTPNEVQGLQSLAMAHGGSLTVNPETGLPEAGFLSNLLPTIIGAGLSIASGGALSPLMAAGITGGGYAIATGSLGKGLMAGLGAYGGAGLAGSLASAAPVDAAAAAMQTPALHVANAQMPVAAGSFTPAAGTGVEAMKAGMYGTNAAGQPLGVFSTVPGPYAPPAPSFLGMQGGQTGANLTAMQQNAAATSPIVRSTEATVADTGMRQAPSVLTNVGAGIKELFNDPEKLKKYVSENKMTLASSLLPALLSREEAKRAEEPVYNLRNYNWNRPFNPSPIAPGSTAERTYFADGGMTVENMSQQNAMMDNPRYPMAYQNTPTYALPSERPISQNVLYPATDAGVTPYSGIASLAKGGPAVLTPGSSTAQPKASPAKGVPVSSPLAGPGYGSMYFGPSVAAATAPKVVPAPVVPPPISSTGIVGGAGTLAAMKEQAKTDRALSQAARIPPAPPPKAPAQTTTTTTKAPVTTTNTSATTTKPPVIKEVKTGLPERTSEGITARGYTGTTKTGQKTSTTVANFEPKTITADDVRAAFKKQKITREPNEDEIRQYTVGKNKATSLQDLDDKVFDFVNGNDPGTTKTTPTSGQQFAATGEPTSSTYKKVAYGAITPTTGWDKAVRYIEPDEITKVFNEVALRDPTQAEIDKYLGKKMSLQGLADAVNKTPDLNEKRTFTDDELQDLAKYYWGKELTTSQLKGFKNFTSLRQVRNAFGSEKPYIDNLNKINETAFTKQQTSLAGPAALLDVSSAFYDIMQRKPNSTELDALLAKNLTEADLEKELKKSNEYVHRFLLYSPNSDKYIGDLNPYGATTKPKEGEVAEEEVPGEEVPGEEVADGTVTLPRGGGSGLVPGVTYKPLSAADLEKFKKEYREYKPSDYSGNVSTYLTSILPQNVSTQSIYTPLGATGALPEYKIEGAMPYYRPEETLGLTNLYSQLAAKAPDLATGLSFTPTQGQIATSPFANTTPGLITLKSSALPQKYVPPTPIIPGTTTQIAALTPEEQAILSSSQSLPQNVEPYASGGIAGHSYNLGDYSDGGRLLKGPGDGVSDSIPASIGNRRPARLADGEFVIPARIVSELGNGSTDAGARQLYAMMDRIQKARRRSVGKGRVAVDSNARKLLPV
jgi:hypothetical protein